MSKTYTTTNGLHDLIQGGIMKKSKPEFEVIKETLTETCTFKLLLRQGDEVPHYFIYLRGGKKYIGEIRITEAEQVFFVPAEYVQLSVEVMTDICYFITKYVNK